ncbi:metalloregulator ArsR/SmtB family transcription factor [Thermosipho sp. (in: thermotogales)]|uniref:ArsR/SmtB family transcription factor n=1 Tax=Thermosipho sp. (in: thermotogales) TaxID=1968895 RepID=UPI002580616F|nr:metalloregulator ArsR/SmtB family transcription factor [Thermosipho sp. (in: thermotogales)]MBZ4650876.1 transcriptional regulator, ArsR family [Thermosipho sp. (in: thermotogales)]
MEKFEEAASILKALGHPIRLKILYLLSEKEHCVCELLSQINTSQPNLSQHLSILRNLKLIKDERNGNMVKYKLQDNKLVKAILSALK